MLLSLQPYSSRRQSVRQRHDLYTQLSMFVQECCLVVARLPLEPQWPIDIRGHCSKGLPHSSHSTTHKHDQEGVSKGKAVQARGAASQGRG
jgi:hypothetical protein